VISPLTVQTVTTGDFTLPITRLLIYVERQTRRASDLFYTSLSTPEGQNAYPCSFMLKKKIIVKFNFISFLFLRRSIDGELKNYLF